MSPRTEETNARIREEQKERILEAPKAIFAHKVFLATDAINSLAPSDCALLTPASLFSHAA